MQNVLAISNYTACLFVSIEGGRLILTTGTRAVAQQRRVIGRSVANMAQELHRQVN